MDGPDRFRQGLDSMVAKPSPQTLFVRKHPTHVNLPVSYPFPHQFGNGHSELPRIAHTLTACCRCRQRKTRCDPSLPRCLPCERSGAVCEYYDTVKGRRINRSYVVKLRESVRELEAELAQYTDEVGQHAHHQEDMLRPDGLVRLSEEDEMPRYLGPSSGVGLTRILMQEAKRHTESKSIVHLLPDLRGKRVGPGKGGSSGSSVDALSATRKFPATSDYPAQEWPSRSVVHKLVDLYRERAQIFTPILHEETLLKDTLAVLDHKDQDPYRRFVTNMVIAISLQQLEPRYAGLADSFHRSALQRFEDVIRPKDLRTLQCLVLVGQYSLLTPTRTAAYYVVGLATRICQQLGFSDEKTIALGITDPVTLDLRRRVSWAVMTQEFGLADSMGRPTGYAKGDDRIHVHLFATVDDSLITRDGIQPGPSNPRKLVAIHFCEMCVLQAEIRRVLYEQEEAGPKREDHAWFAQMEEKLRAWREAIPREPLWCKPWFTTHFYTILVALFRPCPRLPNPTSRAAIRCLEAGSQVIHLSSQRVSASTAGISWTFLLSLYASLNSILWAVTYADVRAAHGRQEVEQIVETALDTIGRCSAHWEGIDSATHLYLVIAKACMQNYDGKDVSPAPSTDLLNTSLSLADNSPSASDPSRPTPCSRTKPQRHETEADFFSNAIPFGFTFPSPGTELLPPPFGSNTTWAGTWQPTVFRSNSIFYNPATALSGRRGSSLPPDSTHGAEHIDQPLESLPATCSPSVTAPLATALSTPTPFTMSPRPEQKQLLARSTDWSDPMPAYLLSPGALKHDMGHEGSDGTGFDTFWPHTQPDPHLAPRAFEAYTPCINYGLHDQFPQQQQQHQHLGSHAPPCTIMSFDSGTDRFSRHDSLSREQQVELMHVLETQGSTDIDAYLHVDGGTGEGAVWDMGVDTGMGSK